METMKMTTITVSQKTRTELLKVAAELQSKTGKKVDYEDAIEWLILKSKRNPELLKRAMIKSGVSPEEFRETLRQGREEDRRHEEALERRYLSQG
jgi:hypothetical protein